MTASEILAQLKDGKSIQISNQRTGDPATVKLVTVSDSYAYLYVEVKSVKTGNVTTFKS